MVETKDTVSSDYGPLTLCDTKDDVARRHLPNLQFEDGDLVVKLGHKPEAWLLIHSSILRATCPLFNRSLSQQWEETHSIPQEIKHPRTGRMVLVRSRALKCVDGTFLLEGQTVLTTTDKYPKAFANSRLVSPGWPWVCHYGDVLAQTQRFVRVLISLLYGARLNAIQINDERLDSAREAWLFNDFAHTIINICAFAEYLGCLREISPRILTIIKSAPDFWEAVSLQPREHLLLSVKLEDAEIYRDALRHMIKQSYHNWTQNLNWSHVAEYLNYTEDDLKDYYHSQFERLRSKLQSLRQDLQHLQLFETQVKWNGPGRRPVYTRLFDILQSKRGKRRSAARVHFLAVSIYSEYLTYRISGEKVTDGFAYWPHPEPQIKPLTRLFFDIEKAARSTNPAALFDTATPVHFAALFNLSRNETQQLEKNLNDLVRTAGRIVETAFSVVHSIDETFDEPETTKRANFDADSENYFTYFKLPDELPWVQDEETHVSRSSQNIVSSVRVADVSPEWLQTLVQHYAEDAAPV